MAIPTGSQLASYKITGLLGVGGMGEVYRAHDPKLNRDVAIKVLPEEFSNDADRVSRFHREAQSIAQLNHPNIAAIYEFAESQSTRFLVLELVEGETLAERLRRGPLPIDEALDLAKQILEALEAAHEKGIVHRDLKPANVKITPGGKLKVLDFGLAKATEMGATDLSPTLISETQGGFLGTPAYSSPEQIRGKTIDKRTDIWSFGVVLFEMLSGKAPFHGETTADVLTSILHKEVSWESLPARTPPSIRRLVRRCLAKDVRERLHDIADARLEITDVASGKEYSAAVAGEQRRRSNVALATVAACMVGFAVLILLWRPWASTESRRYRIVRTAITPAGPASLISGGTVRTAGRDLGISPDGSRFAYVGGNGTQLYLRDLNSLAGTPIGPRGAPRHPFFSPDGAWIGFFDDITLKKVPVSGGRASTICEVAGLPRGGTWLDDDTIIFATNEKESGLWRVAANGGKPTLLTNPDTKHGEGDHLWPEAIHGANKVLFTITPELGSVWNSKIAVLDLKTNAQTTVMNDGSHGHYVATGHLIYGAAGTLRAAPFDAKQNRVLGAPVPVVQPVDDNRYGEPDFDISADGTLIYVPGSTEAITRTLVWVDRNGHEEDIGAEPRAYYYPRIAPDGSRVAVEIRERDNDIWIWDFVRRTLTRFTTNPGQDEYAVWSSDSRTIFFSSGPSERMNIFRQAVDGSGTPERLSDGMFDQRTYGLSPDGTKLLFRQDAETQDLMTLSLAEPHRITPLIKSRFKETNGEISPDGHWVAYQADFNGQDQIYVSPFPGPGGRWQISSDGGIQPLWSRSGKELFFLTTNGELMKIDFQATAIPQASSPVKLLEKTYLFGGGTVINNSGRTYDVSPDGKRFLMVKSGGTSDQVAPSRSIVIVQNWLDELKR